MTFARRAQRYSERDARRRVRAQMRRQQYRSNKPDKEHIKGQKEYNERLIQWGTGGTDAPVLDNRQAESNAVIGEEYKPQEDRQYNLGNWHEPISIKQTLFTPALPNQVLTVKGQIVSAGKIHSMIIQTISESVVKEARAIRLELMDVDGYNDIESLIVVLANELAQDVRVGENVMVSGTLRIEKKKKDIGFPVLYAHDLRYIAGKHNQEEDNLSPEQIQRVHKFIELIGKRDNNDIIDRLVWMYSKQVIGNETIKEALLYALTSVTANLSTGTDIGMGRRRRLNVGLIGFPGGGKTFVAKSLLKYNHRNRFESAQSSSGKSLTAMISREGEGGRILRVGSVAKAKQALCIIDEIGELPKQEQSLLQGVMEEGWFTLNKWGFNATIKADTVVVWTSNPKDATNINTNLTYKEIPIRKQILDRTDIIVVMKPITTPEEREEFNTKKLEWEMASKARKKIGISNYDDYLRLHLAVMKRKYSDKDIELSPEAAKVISDADVEMQQKKLEGAGSHRTTDTFTRLTEIIAKLKLKDKADESDARRAVEFYQRVSTINTNGKIEEEEAQEEDPALETKEIMLDVLANYPETAFTIAELAQKAVTEAEIARQYLGKDVENVRTNKRLRRVINLLSTDNEVVRVSQVPIKFMYRQEEE